MCPAHASAEKTSRAPHNDAMLTLGIDAHALAWSGWAVREHVWGQNFGAYGAGGVLGEGIRVLASCLERCLCLCMKLCLCLRLCMSLFLCLYTGVCVCVSLLRLCRHMHACVRACVCVFASLHAYIWVYVVQRWPMCVCWGVGGCALHVCVCVCVFFMSCVCCVHDFRAFDFVHYFVSCCLRHCIGS